MQTKIKFWVSEIIFNKAWMPNSLAERVRKKSSYASALPRLPGFLTCVIALALL